MTMLDRDALAVEFEAVLQRECSARGIEFSDVKFSLQCKWLCDGLQRGAEEDVAKNAPYLAILRKARECKQRADLDGYNKACVEWLTVRHGAKIGDVVQLGGWAKPRTVRLDGIELDFGLGSDDLSSSYATFLGPCLKPTLRNRATHHVQSMDDYVWVVEPAACGN